MFKNAVLYHEEGSSETLVPVCQITRRCNSEDRNRGTVAITSDFTDRVCSLVRALTGV